MAVALFHMASHHDRQGTIAHPTPGTALHAAEYAVLARIQRLLGPVTVALLWQRLLAYGTALAPCYAPPHS